MLFRSELLRKIIADSKRAAYTTAYEQCRYSYQAASASDPDNLDQTVADYSEEEYEDAPPNASPQNIRNLMEMLAIATP